jgi:hypothetical protein
MILSAEWQIVATTRSANSAWAWRLVPLHSDYDSLAVSG